MKVSEGARDILATEALALADQLPPGERRAEFQELAWAAEQGEIPQDLEDRAGELLGLTLETGRVRSVHGPGGVQALVGVWRETPQGRALTHAVEELNQALSALRGSLIESLRVAPTAPGAYSITIAAGDAEVRLTIDRAGARLSGINVGVGGVGE
ncbi:MAG TPA: hypothetical protein VEN82_00205 [Actinomycetota bacterium]|nr:hypothetical protein [Actinomycetota bacterium]